MRFKNSKQQNAVMRKLRLMGFSKTSMHYIMQKIKPVSIIERPDYVIVKGRKINRCLPKPGLNKLSRKVTKR